jgi:hypothetical protein
MQPAPGQDQKPSTFKWSEPKSLNRTVDDTTDEESNLPDRTLDEEIYVPVRPYIEDIYKDVRHEWAEPSTQGKVVADTSDEEANLPGECMRGLSRATSYPCPMSCDKFIHFEL